jgi:hypothetical protein
MKKLSQICVDLDLKSDDLLQTTNNYQELTLYTM